MSASTMRKIETRFSRRAASGRGIGLDEAVASAEGRLEIMGDTAREEIAAMLGEFQQDRCAIAAGEPLAMARVRSRADGLAGVAGIFGMPEIGQVAKSLCQLFDAASPAHPNADAVRVHLEALRILQGLGPAAMTGVAPAVLAGLEDVVAVERRRNAPPSGVA